MSTWDAIVVGGGLAGSTAAIYLARKNKNVLLLEKERTAHHKVCGEFISYEAVHYLKLLGVELPQLGAETIDYVRVIHGATLAETKLPWTAFSLSRYLLDENLLKLAKENGAHIQRGITVTGLEHTSVGWNIKCKEKTFISKSTFLATGKHNVQGWSRVVPGQNSNMIGFKMHCKLDINQTKLLKNHVEIILFSGGYAGIQPIENDLVNFCLIINKEKYKAWGKQWTTLLENLFTVSPHIKNRLNRSYACWNKPLAIFGIPYGFVYKNDINESAKELYRLGDQMAVIPSFAGDGMAIALHTAHIAIDYYLTNNSKKYHRKAYVELKPQIRWATRLSRLISMSIAQKLIIYACKIAPGIITKIVTRTRLRLTNC